MGYAVFLGGEEKETQGFYVTVICRQVLTLRFRGSVFLRSVRCQTVISISRRDQRRVLAMVWFPLYLFRLTAGSTRKWLTDQE